MRCSKCGFDNPLGMKFCGQCTTPLALICPKCRFENPPDFKFCGQCTTPLNAKPPTAPRPEPLETVSASVIDSDSEKIEDERKTVTALFADIKGSTELEQDLDPEEARAIVDPALKLMIDAVRRYDGYVVQSTGDGIFALFGAPLAHEDHPQRALYAALRMQEELRRYSTRLREAGNLPIEARIGVNTGEVVVRSIATGRDHTEYTPIGHTTNLASRMQALAPTGSIAISEQTRKLVEGYFVLKPLGPTKVKGVSEPVNVYEVTGLGTLRTRLQRAARFGLTKFVGREREMDAIRTAAEVARAGRGQIVAAIAEAGAGKSRLFAEFKARNTSDWMVLETFSVSHGKASAYLPLQALLCSYFKINEDDNGRTRREKVAGRLALLDPSLEGARPYLFALLGIVDGDDDNRRHWDESLDRLDEYLRQSQRKGPLTQMDAGVRTQRTLDAIKRILLRESLNQPLILMFEDLHWIDGETQAFVNLLADSIANSRILLLVNYRPEYSHQWGSKTYYTQLRLDPLGSDSASEMLSAMLGDAPELDPLKRLIITRTLGNPFFMEEMVQVLIDEGVLVRNGAVHLTRPTEALKIPATVQAILASRIDRLPADEKELLQTLAVVGDQFALTLASEVTRLGRDELAPMLDDLQLAEFIYEQPAAGDVEYTFKHALTREVAYNSILTERRKSLHERIGAALETLYGESLDDHLGDLALHYGRSANVRKAIEFLTRAASQASEKSLYAETVGYVNRAIDLLGALPQGEMRAREELELQGLKGAALMAVKGFTSDEVGRAYARARDLAQELKDFDQEFAALQGLWGFRYTRGDDTGAASVAAELMEQASQRKQPALLKYAHYALGASLQQAGKLAEARDHLEQAVALGTQEAPPRRTLLGPEPSVLCLTTLSDVLFGLGYPDQGLRRSHEAMSVVTRESDPFSYAMAMLFLAQAYCMWGEGKKGEELCRDLIDLSDRHGFPFWMAAANRVLCLTIAIQARWEEAIATINKMLSSSAGIDDSEPNQYGLLPLLAGANAQLGELDAAFEVLARWQAMREKHPLTPLDQQYYRVHGELLLKAGSVTEAEACLRRAIELSRAQAARSEQLRAAIGLARLLRDTNRRDEARTMLAEIYDWFTEGFDTPNLKDARALFEELGDPTAD
jgi:class 3 adenylate cyclase/tetratricopeptide (TPR) repeat protein